MIILTTSNFVASHTSVGGKLALYVTNALYGEAGDPDGLRGRVGEGSNPGSKGPGFESNPNSPRPQAWSLSPVNAASFPHLCPQRLGSGVWARRPGVVPPGQHLCLAVVCSCLGAIRVVKATAFREGFRILLVRGQNSYYFACVSHAFF